MPKAEKVIIQVIIPKPTSAKYGEKALRRATDQDIRTHHRSELAELEMEKANVWRTMDANKDDWKVQMSGTAQLRHSRPPCQAPRARCPDQARP